MKELHSNPILRIPQSSADYRYPDFNAGGGPKEIVEVTENLRAELSERIDGLQNYFKDTFKKWPRLPAIGKVILREKALAKSHRPLKLLERADNDIIGTAGIGEMLVAFTPKSLERLRNEINNNNTKIGRANISAIENFLPFNEFDKLGGEKERKISDLIAWLDINRKLKVELFRHRSPQFNIDLENNFLSLTSELGAEVNHEDYLTLSKIYSLITKNHKVLELILNFPGLRSLAPMPHYFSEFISSQAIIVGDADPKHVVPPTKDKSYPLVGIIDSGIEPNHGLLSPWISSRATYVPPFETDYSHGTFVGGLLVSAKSINFEDPNFPEIKSRIVDICALGKMGASESDIKARILESVQRFPEVRVWNLSLGGQVPGDLSKFSEFAQMLDQLSDTTGCLFVIASGNYQTIPLRSRPPQSHIGIDDRISIPAESVRGLTVGSFAHLSVANSAVVKGDPSPFSRRGPGPASIPKPEVTHIGGNCSLNGDFTYTAVRSLLPGGKVGEDIGTSFSTPLVSLLAAHTWDEIERAGSLGYPELIKALLIHSAAIKSPSRPATDLHYFGFGQPGELPETLYCDPSAFTLLFEVDVRDGADYEKFPYPIPPCLRTQDNKFRGEVIITLCYAPPLDGRFGAEYCRANIDVSFGTYDMGADGKRHQNGLIPLEPIDKNKMYESSLIEHGFKWSPTKVYRKQFPKGVAGQDWRLKLSVLRRSGEPAPDEPQRAIVLVTLKSLDNNPDVYSDGVRALSRIGWTGLPISAPIQIQA